MSRLAVVAVVVLAAAAGVAALLLRDDAPPQPRPELQRVLERLTSGPDAAAPGAVAYVSGPRGSWLGAAGLADVGSGDAMRTDARMRLESVSKIYTAALVQLLARDGRLRLGDTVERRLPGLLPEGRRITIRHLLTMQSGLIDNNDVTNATDAELRELLGRVRDPALRRRLLELGARVERDRSTEFDPLWWVRLAAWQPLLFEPGYGVRYSNIGYDVVGLVAARAGGAPLAELFRERIFEPLGLDATAYDPQGPISGPHARGYGLEGGARVDATRWHSGVGAEGGIVSDAADTAAFLQALMRGELVPRRAVEAMQAGDLWLGGAPSGCGGPLYGWSGGGFGYKTEAWVDGRGDRVVVLLLNGRHLGDEQPLADAAVSAAASELFCAA